MTTKVHQWIHGAASALIGGAANAVTVCIIDPAKFNIHEGWKNTASAALVSGVVSLAFYLKKFPTPDDIDTQMLTKADVPNPPTLPTPP